MPQITFENIYVSYSNNKNVNHVLDDLNVIFEDGKVNVILGESGCGKTTLLRLVSGGLNPSKGKIYFDDLDITNFSIRDRNIALVSQNITLYPHLNVFRNISFPLMHTVASGDEIKERVYDVAKLLHIEHLLTRKPKQISLGQAQRVAIAKAIIKRPNVFLFDEPFSNLDEPLRLELRNELKRILINLNTTTLFVTHSIKEAMAIGDFIYIMDKGKIVEKLEAKNLLEAKSDIAKELIKNEFGEKDVFLK